MDKRANFAICFHRPLPNFTESSELYAREDSDKTTLSQSDPNLHYALIE